LVNVLAVVDGSEARAIISLNSVGNSSGTVLPAEVELVSIDSVDIESNDGSRAGRKSHVRISGTLCRPSSSTSAVSSLNSSDEESRGATGSVDETSNLLLSNHA